MTGAERDRFDALLEEAIEELPDRLRDLLEDVPVIVEDRPGRALLDRIGMRSGRSLCGLHTGVPLTERSVEHSGALPDQIQLFREGIVRSAGGWRDDRDEEAVYEQIVVTLLHEIGHHFGLDEDDLAELGYG